MTSLYTFDFSIPKSPLHIDSNKFYIVGVFSILVVFDSAISAEGVTLEGGHSTIKDHCTIGLGSIDGTLLCKQCHFPTEWGIQSSWLHKGLGHRRPTSWQIHPKHANYIPRLSFFSCSNKMSVLLVYSSSFSFTFCSFSLTLSLFLFLFHAINSISFYIKQYVSFTCLFFLFFFHILLLLINSVTVSIFVSHH